MNTEHLHKGNVENRSPDLMAPAPPGQAPEPEKNHWGVWIVVLLVIAAGVAALVLFRGKKQKPPPPPPVSISVTNVQKGNIDVAVSSLGSVTPIYTASISPRVDGQVIQVNYTEGQVVASNDLLVVVDPGQYQAQVTSAAGQLERDKAALQIAKIDLDRYKAAAAKKAVPQQQVDDQTWLVRQDQGTVNYDQGQLDNANVQLAYCYIRAPFAGRVGLRLVDPGNVVHAANTNPVVVLTQLQPITVIFNVAEDYLPAIERQLHQGHQMTIQAWDRANENVLATGSFLALDNVIDVATGTVRIKALFTNEDLSLFPNQFVNARLIIQTLHGQDLVPTYAIQHSPDGDFAYVVTNGTFTTNGSTTNFSAVSMRTITAGIADANDTAIKEGLNPGDVIALDNFNKLGDGVKVVIHHPGTEPAGGAGKHKGGSYGHKSGDNATNSSGSGGKSGS